MVERVRGVRRAVVSLAVGVGLLAGPTVALVAPTPAAAAGAVTPFAGTYTRVSVPSAPSSTPERSGFPVLNGDGTLVLFTSSNSHLVAGDTNGTIDLFLHDRTAGTTERINVTPSGGQADGPPGPYSDERGAISPDGRFVAFSSLATNLVAGDTNGQSDVFLRDRQAGTTVRVSTTSSGAQGGGMSYGPQVTADGSSVIFVSSSSLAPADTDGGYRDVYRKDLTTGGVQLLSTGLTTETVDSQRSSSDGRWTVYTAGNRLLRRDAQSGSVVDVITALDGGAPDRPGYPGGISDDGNRIAFRSDATNTVAGDAPGSDAFLADVAAGTTRRLTTSVAGSASVWETSMSTDGSTMAWYQMSRPMTVLKIDADDRITFPSNSDAPWLDADGDTVVFSTYDPRGPGDFDDQDDVYVADLGPDVVAPTVTCDPADGAWHAGGVDVRCIAQDSGSGLANPFEEQFHFLVDIPDGTTDADASSEVRSICDLAGNCTDAASSGHKIDRTDPVASIDESSTGAFVRGADVPAGFGCTDAGSGIESCTATAGGTPVEPGDPIPTVGPPLGLIEVTATDGVGRTHTAREEFTLVDDALRGTISRSDEGDLAGTEVSLWTEGGLAPEAVTFTDNAGGYRFGLEDLGAGTFRLRISRPSEFEQWHGGADQASATPIEVGVRPQTVDVAANTTVDDTPPTVDCIEPEPGLRIWDVGVLCFAEDDVALDPSSPPVFVLSTSVDDGTETHDAVTSSQLVCDLSANCSMAGPFGPYSVDRKAPDVTIEFPADGDTFLPGEHIAPVYDCSDLNLQSCVRSPSSWPLPSTPGTHTFTVTAHDEAGWETVVTHTYTVVSTTLRGVLIENPTEQPIGGALVSVWASADPRTGPPTATTITSPNGAWSVPGLIPNSPYYVRYSKAGYESLWHGGQPYAESAVLIGGPVPQSQVFTGWLRALDATPPTISCSPPSTSPWRPMQVTVSCTATDPSGVIGSPTTVLATNVAAGTETPTAYTSSVEMCDTAGNCATAGPFGPYKIDRKAPTYTCPGQTPAWTATERVAFCTGADGGSGTVTTGFALQTNVGSGNFSASASTNTIVLCDAVGNCAPAQLTGLRVDRAAPVASCAPVPTTWFSSNQTVTCAPSDAGVGYSGPVNVLGSTNVAAGQETTNGTATMILCDLLNNCAPKMVGGFKIDRKGPTITCAAPDGTWRNANVSLACSHADGGVGLPATYNPFPPFTFNQPYPINFNASTSVAAGSESASANATATQKCDQLNNCTAVSIAGNKIDRKAPTSTCPAASSGWLASNASVTCTVADGGSGSETASYQAATAAAAGTETATATMGLTSVCDRVGNCANLGGPGPWKIDRKAAAVTCDPAPDPGTFSDGDITVDCAATDGGSGLAEPGDASFALSTSVGAGEEGTVSTGSRSVCDAVGGCTTAGPFGPYDVDRKAPSVTITRPADGQVVELGTPLIADHECSDLFLVSCEAGTADGTELPGSLGEHTVTVTATDRAGRTTIVTRTYEVVPVDDAAPTVTCTPPAPSATWRATQVTVSCEATDPSGLADPAQAAFTVATSVEVGEETASAATATVEVCDGRGNCVDAGGFGPYRIDRKGPVPTCEPLTTAWSKVNLSSRCTAADGGAGLVSSAAFSLTTTVGAGAWDADASTGVASSCDKVGNCTPAQLHGLKVDRAGPVVSCGPVPTGWSKTNVSIPCTPTDAGSGYTGPATVSAVSALGQYQESDAVKASVTVCDVAGTCTTEVVTGLKVDRLAPSVACAAPDGAWHAENVSLPCEQSDGGSGLSSSSPNGGGDFAAVTDLPAAASSANVKASSVPSCDQVGNCRTVSISGNKIDRKVPTATCPAADTGWHDQNVTVTCAVVDAGAGAVIDSAVTSTTVADGVENRSAALLVVPVCDLVGNCATLAPTARYKIDRKAPTVRATNPRSGTTHLLGATLTPAYTCGDGGSGLVSCTAPSPSGVPFVVSAEGPATFSIVAEDQVGNRTTVDIGYTVVAPSVNGRVTDSSGAGVEGVAVSRYAATGDGPPLETVFTDANGAYRFVGMPAGSYRFGAVKPGAFLPRWYSAGSLATAPAIAFNGTTSRTLAVMKLVAAASMSGTVTSSSTGEPIAGVQVALTTSAAVSAVPVVVVTTDGQGRWSAPALFSGTYRYQLVADGYRSEWHTNATVKAYATPVVVGVGAHVPGLVDDLTPTP